MTDINTKYNKAAQLLHLCILHMGKWADKQTKYSVKSHQLNILVCFILVTTDQTSIRRAPGVK